MDDFNAWFTQLYIDSKNIDNLEGSALYRKYMGSLGTVPRKFSGEMRMQKFIRLRYLYPISSEGYVAAVFYVKTASITTIFAMAYIRHNGEVEYVCLSPTYDSKDGEYRHSFISYKAFTQGYDKNAAVMSQYEEVVLGLIARDKLNISMDIFPSDEGKIQDERLPIKLLSAVLLVDIRKVAVGSISVHTNTEFLEFVKSMIELAPNLVETSKINERVGIYFMNGSPYQSRVECGQKVVPLTLREVMFPNNINFGAWRELYARQKASDLVINMITPSMAIENQWFYINDCNQGIFQNMSMRRQYQRSKTVDMAVAQLRSARKIIDPELKQENSASLASFDAHVYESIEDAQGFLLLSDVALCTTMEHIGETFGTFTLAAKTKIIQKDVLSSIDAFEKLAFDMLYGAHCAHKKIGIVHTDIHPNNMTLYRIMDNPSSFIKDPVVAYIIGPHGEADTFVFPFNGIIGCLIDFSRCIYGPALVKELSAEMGSIPVQNFYRDQIPRIMRTLERYAPTFAKNNQEKIKAALLKNGEITFRILSYVDYIAISHSLAQTVSKHPIDASPAMTKFVQSIEKSSREYFVTYLHDLVESQNFSEMKVVFAGDALLAKIFDKYKFDLRKHKNTSLCDIFNFNNELKSSGQNYDNFPIWAKLSEMVKQFKDLDVTKLVERGLEPFFDSLLLNPKIETIADRVRAEQDALDGPEIATSSWLSN